MQLKYATVLIVDDESMLLDIFREWMEEENCRILTAENGAIAVQILRRHHVDVVVSDVRMPVMDGIILLKNLTTYLGVSGNIDPPKMIFISGFTDLEPREAYDLGVEVLTHKTRAVCGRRATGSPGRRGKVVRTFTSGWVAVAHSPAEPGGCHRTRAYCFWSRRFLCALYTTASGGTCSF
jgi:CheY-like chemotaxis protein